MSKPEIIEDFFGVYLLCCFNPKYKGRTYIGYTRDPNRRITQHNRGTWAGGAHRTNNKGPWKMVMIVHGFPNNISALRFEWAWQNPNKTTRLQYLNLRKIPRKETELQFKIRVLSEMLRVGPWSRLPLVIRWLETDLYQEFPGNDASAITGQKILKSLDYMNECNGRPSRFCVLLCCYGQASRLTSGARLARLVKKKTQDFNRPEKEHPSHMIVKQGPVKAKLLKKVQKESQTSTYIECLLCSSYLNSDDKLTCLNADCELVTHLTCLADLFLTAGEYVPIGGNCPFCNVKLLWGDLIRKMKGCSQTPIEGAPDDDDKYSDDDAPCSQDDRAAHAFVDNDSWFLECNDDL